MTIKEIKERLCECVTALEFDYKGIHGGVDPFSKNDFDLWYGDECVTVYSIDEVMSTDIYAGKTLPDIIDDIENVDGL